MLTRREMQTTYLQTSRIIPPSKPAIKVAQGLDAPEHSFCLIVFFRIKPFNRALHDEGGKIYDIIPSAFLVVGLTEDSFGPLGRVQLKEFIKRFDAPELFMNYNGKS